MSTSIPRAAHDPPDARRYLDTAAFSHPGPWEGLQPNRHQHSLEQTEDVRTHLCSLTGCTDSTGIGFRPNATQIFRDLVRLWTSDARRTRAVVMSDLDHPVLLENLAYSEPLVPTRVLRVRTLLHDRGACRTEAVADALSASLESCQDAMVCIPHVDWLTGARIDAIGVARVLRSRFPASAIVVDGAQAVGQSTTNDVLTEDGVVDCYFSSAQKWMGLSEPLGIAWFSPAFLYERLDTSERRGWFVNDLFSSYAGAMPPDCNFTADSYHLGLLRSLATRIRNAERFPDQRHWALQCRRLRSVVPPSAVTAVTAEQTAFFTVGGPRSDVLRVHGALDEQGFAHSLISVGDCLLIRLCAPPVPLTAADLAAFANAMQHLGTPVGPC